MDKKDMRKEEGTPMEGVTEYAEGYKVWLIETDGAYVGHGKARPGAGRLVIQAWNEAGHNFTEVDLLELLAWVKINRPDLTSSAD